MRYVAEFAVQVSLMPRLDALRASVRIADEIDEKKDGRCFCVKITYHPPNPS